MKTFQVEVNIPADRRLMIELPADIEIGNYQVVVVMSPSQDSDASLRQKHQLNELAGQVKSFAGVVDAVAWQRRAREEWNDN